MIDGLVDFDNHYYEPLDAFTRHLDGRIARQGRGVEMLTKGNRVYAAVGGRISHFIPNVTFDPVAAPGSLEEYFRGQGAGKGMKASAQVEPLRPEYHQRDARLRVMAEQGVDEIVLLPTLAYGIEEALSDDLEAVHASFRAFNRWLDEDWGVAGPTIGAPYLVLSDVGAALVELEWMLERGARVITMRPGPVRVGREERASPADRRFDPVWRQIEAAGVTVAYHAADAGYYRYFQDYGDPARMEPFSPKSRLGSIFALDRPMQDTLASLVTLRLFERFPNLRVVSVEQGSDWLLEALHRLEKLYHRRANLFAEDPLDTVRRHVWVCPFWEDDIAGLVDAVGVERVVFGSDWPHPEGVREPRDFAKYLDGIPSEGLDRVMRANGAELLTRRPLDASGRGA